MSEFTNLRTILIHNSYDVVCNSIREDFSGHRHAVCLDKRCEILVNFFLNSEYLQINIIEEVIGKYNIDKLVDLGLASIVSPQFDHYVKMNFTLRFVDGLLIFYETSWDPECYFGNDSLALARYTAPFLRSSSRVLDICSGPGFQSLKSARISDNVCSVEINKNAVKLAYINSILNAGFLSSNPSITCQDALEFLSTNTKKFDIVVWNPPLISAPKGIGLPYVADGGELGIDLTKKILQNISGSLGDKAVCITQGLTISIESVYSDIKEEIDKWETQYRLRLIQIGDTFEIGSNFFDLVIQNASVHSKKTIQEVSNEYQKLAESYNSTGLTLYVMIIESVCDSHIFQKINNHSGHLWI